MYSYIDDFFLSPSDELFFTHLTNIETSPFFNVKDTEVPFTFNKIPSPFPSPSSSTSQNFFFPLNPIEEPSNSNQIIINDDIDQFILDIQTKVKPLYFNCEFTKILDIIESQFPNFFYERNYSFLYTIQKINFFNLLRKGNVKEINSFYFDSLLQLLKEVKRKNWKRKHNFFIKLMKKRNIFLNGKFLYKYYEQFQFELDKAIRYFLLYIDMDMEIKEELNIVTSNEGKSKRKFDERENDVTNCDNEEQSEVELNDVSTDVEFSDFEDEISNKLSNQNNSEINRNLNEDNGKEEKKNKKKNKNKKDEILFNQLPFLSSFKPKFAKRETLDKKILREFRKFIDVVCKNNTIAIDKSLQQSSYYILFKNGELFPPLDFYDSKTEEHIVFKSFNSNYLIWFFSQNGMTELYSKFSELQGEEFAEDLAVYYEITKEEKQKLFHYIINLPFIFDVYKLRTITQDKGCCFKHIYRQVKGRTRSRDLDESFASDTV